MGRTDSFAFSFPEGNENRDVVAIELAASKAKPEPCVELFESVSKDKKSNTEWCWTFCGQYGTESILFE
jgi:hypothetical protein